MRIIKNIIIFVLPLFFLSSCGSWLNVTPKAEVNLEKMFSNAQGFEDVLIGCYTSMTKKEVYGAELTYGTLDVLAQYYNTDASSHLYNEIAKFIYTGDKAKTAIDEMWLNSFFTIANCNILLDNLAIANKKMFVDNHELFIEAEAKAIRAYLHFDLLRIFAPSWSGGSELTIPYADKFQSSPFTQLTAKQVIDKIIADLEDGRELLKEIDPVFEETFKTDYYHYTQPTGKGRSEFLDFRAYRMNYFAITATLARVYQYIGNKAKAYEYANEIIENKDRFTFTDEGDFIAAETNRNSLMENEILFALNHATIYKVFAFDFSSSTFAIYGKDMIYDIKDDLRLNCFKKNGSNDVTLKYSESSKESSFGGKIPMIRISEMFFIAAESIYETNPQLACDLMNEVRINRGITKELEPNMSYENFVKEITLEYRREFVGEGQLFYRYKRLNGNILRGNGEIEMRKANYTLPLPATEVEFGNYKF